MFEININNKSLRTIVKPTLPHWKSRDEKDIAVGKNVV